MSQSLRQPMLFFLSLALCIYPFLSVSLSHSLSPLLEVGMITDMCWSVCVFVSVSRRARVSQSDISVAFRQQL